MAIKREDVEIRCYKSVIARPAPAVESRDAGGEAPAAVPGLIEGYAAVFNTPIDFGDWREVLAPGCFDEALAATDVVSMWNHSSQYLLGRMSSGTLKLGVDDHGLKMTVALPLGTYIGDYVQAMVDRGDVYGASIMFWVTDEEWLTTVKPYKRIIKKVELMEAGPVYEPAAPDAKIALARMKALVPPAGVEGRCAEGEAVPGVDAGLAAWRDRAELRYRVMKM